ncbi:MAG TPA: GGDEF domain-containing protein [Candidatus Sulfotelmatobacter sp.]
MIAAVVLLVAHVGVVSIFGTATRGPLLSDLLQVTLGGLVLLACLRASHRSEGLSRSVWRLAAGAYLLWIVAQSVSVYNDLFPGSATVSWISNMLFCFWFAPMAMAMFLDSEHEAGRLDALVALDFVQGTMVCIAAYLYFFYLPKTETPGELAHGVWAPYFVGYGFVAGAYLLRAALSRSRLAQQLFGRLGGFLALSGCVDALYYYGPGRGLKTGAWFDILWSVMLVIPLVLAATWKAREEAAPPYDDGAPKREKKIHSELFHLFYPLLVLIMSLRIAQERLGLAATVVFLSFVCSSARLLVTQTRLMKAQEALRREASHDGLTSLWNHKVILETLNRELLRSERHGQPVGVIMADVDDFKNVNDSRGHAAGDVVLRIIASEIAAVVRPYDSVGRYGGEEFLIVAPDCGPAEIWELAERIRLCVANCSIVAAGASLRVTLSLGVATGHSAADAEKLLNAADTALYLAKNSGRNRVEPTAGRAASAGSASSSAAQSSFWL